MIPPGTIIFATSDCDAGREDARAYIRAHGFTREQVRLYVHDGMVLVAAKVELWT